MTTASPTTSTTASTSAFPTESSRMRGRRRHHGLTAPGPRASDRALRIVFAAALTGAIVWMLLHADDVRAGEAHLAAWWMDLWVPRGVTAFDDTYMLWISENHLVGFQVTVECTAVILLVPLLALGAVMMLSTRVSWIRGTAGLAASAAVMVLVNQVRLALIGWSTQQGGLEAGYEIGHRFAGSVVGIAGFAVGLVVLIAVAGIRRRPRSPHA